MAASERGTAAVTLVAGREARHLNHNPLGAWMVVVLPTSPRESGWCDVVAWLQARQVFGQRPVASRIVIHGLSCVSPCPDYRSVLTGPATARSWLCLMSCPGGRADQPSAHE